MSKLTLGDILGFIPPQAFLAYEEILQREDPFLSLEERKNSLLLDVSNYSESSLYRARVRAVHIAEQLFAEGTTLEKSALEEMLRQIQKASDPLSSVCLYPFPGEELAFWEHAMLTLRALIRSRELRDYFSRFSQHLFHHRMEEVIRRSLFLASGAKIEPKTIKIAVLSALLTPIRQSLGSCFATAPAILIQKEQQESFLEDFLQILSKGKISRVIEGKECSIPVQLSSSRALLQRSFLPLEVYPYSYLYPFLLPEVARSEVKKTLQKINRPQEKSLERVLEDLWSDKKKQQQAQQLIIDALVHPLLQIWEYSLASFSEAKMDFSKWNFYTSLGLAFEDAGGIGPVIYQTLAEKLNKANQKIEEFHRQYLQTKDQLEAIERLYSQAGNEQIAFRLKAEAQSAYYHMQSSYDILQAAQKQAAFIAKFGAMFTEELLRLFPQYFQELYDPQMQEIKTDLLADSPAGFRLIYKQGRSDPLSWQSIYNKVDYIQALTSFFRMIEPYMYDLCPDETSKSDISDLITAIIQHVHTDNFYFSALAQAAKVHKQNLDRMTINQLLRSEKKPWAYTAGGRMDVLLKTYYQIEGELKTEKIRPPTPLDLFVSLLDFMKSVPPIALTDIEKNPNTRYLAVSPVHAFSFMPGFQLFSKGWQNTGFSYTWVRDEIILPRKKVYENILLSSQEQELLLREFTKTLSAIPAHIASLHFPSKPYPLTSLELSTLYRSSLQKVGDKLYHELVTAWESFLWSALPLDESERLPPVIFADSNWVDSYFAFVVSPASYEIELWRVDFLGKTGAPLHSWADCFQENGQPWQIFSDRKQYHLLPAASQIFRSRQFWQKS